MSLFRTKKPLKCPGLFMLLVNYYICQHTISLCLFYIEAKRKLIIKYFQYKWETGCSCHHMTIWHMNFGQFWENQVGKYSTLFLETVHFECVCMEREGGSIHSCPLDSGGCIRLIRCVIYSNITLLFCTNKSMGYMYKLMSSHFALDCCVLICRGMPEQVQGCRAAWIQL